MKDLIMKDLENILLKHNQKALLEYINSLPEKDFNLLYNQIKDIDWTFLSYLFEDHKKSGESIIEPITDTLSMDAIQAKKDEYLKIGLEAIRNQELCLLLLAGGQGTRLGFDMPKGTFNMGINKDLYIFQLLIEHTLDVVRMADTWIKFYIMTSDINYDDTVNFFKEHNYFGYNPDYIYFFVQELNPVTDFDGNLLLSSESSLAMSPNGNGGWFSSLRRCGLLDDILNSNLKWINVFAVDNVLQGIADPIFLGATIAEGKMSGAKVVAKANPEEKVGAICTENGKPHIIEYYELSEDMMYQKNPDGALSYGYGVILNYLFPISRLKETLDIRMPLHVVKKAVPYVNKEGELITPDSPNAYKFETLALDLIHEMDDCLVFEVDRCKEFAPVKNKTGVDSVDTARELLKHNGYEL